MGENRVAGLIGQAMIENQLVTKEQLEEGLRYQAKVKKLIGQILVELGYIKEDTLLDFLEGVFYGYKTAPAQQPVKIFSDVDELLASDFEKWLIFMVNKNASDLHLIAGAQPQLRVNGELMSVNVEPLSADNVKTLAYSILDYEEIAGLEQNRALDKSFEIKGLSRYRLNLHWQKDSVGISVRALPLHIPAFAELGIPEVLKEFVTRPSGLVLVTGPAGCGKSTTMAAMIEYINLTRRLHVVTIEDPIEYVFVSKKGLIRQRELGTDTLSFKEALKSVVRQDPNIIFIGEMRDLETIQSALSLAETGHLVLSTLHTQDAVHSVNRIVDVFPMSHQHEVRTKLSLALQAVVVQQLIPRADRNGRALACEILNCTPSVRNLIRENNLAQIRAFIQMGAQYGMRSMNQSLLELYESGIAAWEDIYSRSNDKEELLRMLPK